jgi:hypothetical protein
MLLLLNVPCGMLPLRIYRSYACAFMFAWIRPKGSGSTQRPASWLHKPAAAASSHLAFGQLSSSRHPKLSLTPPWRIFAGIPELWKSYLHDLQDWTYPQLLDMGRKVFGLVDGGKVEVVL